MEDVEKNNEQQPYVEAGEFAGYQVIAFSEQSYPEGANEAWKIQAESYRDMGYVHDTAIDSEGRLFADVDTSRGPNVTYYLAIDSNGTPQASLRMGSIPMGGSVDDLSSYWHAKPTLYKESIEYIDQYTSAAGEESIKDCSAICKKADASPLATYVAIRQALQDSIRSGKQELWVMALTEEAFRPLKESFGSSMWRTGDEISPNSDDSRISNETRLVPAAAEIWLVPERLVESIQATDDIVAQKKYIRTLQLVASGLSDQHLSADPAIAAQIRTYLGM